jgi:hypothetical protein
VINIRFRDEGTYVVAVCQGKWEPDTVTEAATRIRDFAVELSHNRILIDWRNVPGPITSLHRFMAGEVVARILTPPFRVAVLAQKELINKLAETTAVNRGALFLVSHDEQDLLRWLLEGLPGSEAK